MHLDATRPGRRVLMSVDSVGGVWRYAMDLAAGLAARHGTQTVFLGFGPEPGAGKRDEAEAIGKLIWTGAPLDWTATGPEALADIPAIIARHARAEEVDLLHLNLPSQAAGLDLQIPVATVSHSCVVTWFAGVRGHGVPEDWQWQYALNRKGFDRADAVIAPSRSHAAMLAAAYGPIGTLSVIHNGSRFAGGEARKEGFVLAAGRWWDDGKNGAVLDRAARDVDWPVVLAGPNTGPNGQFLPLSDVIHRGELSHAETMGLMERAAIVVSPSLYEPFGLAPLEAARAGAALVLADIPTYRELWEGAALFAGPHDVQAFAAAINRLSRDEALRGRMGQEARARSRLYTVEAQETATARIHDAILHQHSLATAAE